MTRPGGATPPGWRMFGIPVYLAPSWFIIAGLVTWSLARGYYPAIYPELHPTVYWLMGLVSSVLLFACVLLHELGHSVVARQHGVPVACVTLFLLGGVAQIVREAPRPSAEMKIALAGPLVSAGLALVLLPLAEAIPITSVPQLAFAGVLRYLGIANLVLLIFNMLPGFPLDGGRLLRAALWGATGDFRRSTRIAARVGSGIGLALLVLGVATMVTTWSLRGIWYVLLGWFVRNAALASARSVAYLDQGKRSSRVPSGKW
ncbi:MAG TPA: site-2 protease family protein [bacterium]